ncbi:PSD1 and planctomycete cytochrome C domain-containing protein [soil metagenome]
MRLLRAARCIVSAFSMESCFRSRAYGMLRVVPLSLVITLGFTTFARAQMAGEELFEKKVRPILTQRCISCHGAKKAKSGLRLDSRSNALRGGQQGPAVVPGDVEKSLLIQAIGYEGDVKMPPAARLPDGEIATLKAWVSQGMSWPEQKLLESAVIAEAGSTHWAFRPIQNPKQPVTDGKSTAATPIDAFVEAGLAKASLTPSLRADRRTLIRRAAVDLLGLNPSIDEIAAFEADTGPDAYERLIDRLLASPQYGERWARHWLDVSRYADDKGYVFFEDKSYPFAFTFRDYVIDALNRDLPFDRFVLEQLAADQLPHQPPRTLAALGFLTTGGHFMNNTHDIIDDRIDLVSRGLMGITVTCARCHDHKFDPIPQADYYSLYGVFRSCQEPTVGPLIDPLPNTAEARKQEAAIQASEQKLLEFVKAKHTELVEGARKRAAEYLVEAHIARNKPPEDDFMLLADKGDLNPTMITRWKVYLKDRAAKPDAVWLPWHKLADVKDGDLIAKAPALLAALKADSRINRLVRETLPTKIASMKELAAIYGKLLARVDGQWQAAIEGAIWSGAAFPARLADADVEELRQVLYGRDVPADAPLALDWGFLSLFPDRTTQAEYQKLLKDLEVCCQKGQPRAMALLDSPRTFDPQVFERGQPNRLGEGVPRQFPRVANPQRQPFQTGSGRLEMAREIVSPKNPLTARVIVNRIWMHHFGVPLVNTPSDFGLRSDPPTHPELLDWLASDFVAHDWSLKRLHRLILTSATYMQTSVDRQDCLKVDPENRFYWRMNRRRLEYEALHDVLLSVSGELNQSMRGASVPLMGPQHRRSIYERVERLEFSSLLTTFDVPSPAATSPGRIATTVPPQSLFLMNSPYVREIARRIVQKLQLNSDVGQRIDRAFATVLGRKPESEERSWAARMVADGSRDQWLDLVHALLMTNEFVFVD